MDLRKLKTLIDLVSESGISELEVTEGEGKVRIVKNAPPVYVQPSTSYAPQIAAPAQPFGIPGEAPGAAGAPAAPARAPPRPPPPPPPPPLPPSRRATSSRRRWSARSTAHRRRAPSRSSRW